jgi:hypothetical protein
MDATVGDFLLQRLTMLVGAGALNATDEIIETADLLGATGAIRA